MAGTGLSTSLRSLVNSLNVNQTTLGYLSENISNVNTVGYTRKIVSQETRVANGVVLGVDVAEIRRSIDEFLIAANRTQLSNYGEAETKKDFYDRIQSFTLGDPGSSSTITNTLNEFYTRLDDFANDPSSPVKKALTVTAASDLVNSITNVSKGVYTERLNADQEIQNTVNELNSILSALADINNAIRQNGVVGGNVESLLDARDVQIDKLKEIIDADINYNEFNQVIVSISSAELLGSTQRYNISYSRVSSVEDLINGSPTSAITVTAYDPNGNLSQNVETLLSASNADTAVDNIPSGRLRALIDLRDVELPTITDQLDNFVYSFANAFNEIHNNGSGYPPPRSLTGTEQFSLNDEFLFSGSFRLTLLNQNGSPISNRYGDDFLPLVLNFDEFDGEGNGKGTASIASILEEINNYYGVQSQRSVNVGDAHDIKVAAVSTGISTTKATGSITFSGQPSIGDEININGTLFTFVANGSTPAADELELGLGLGGTIENMVTSLNSSTDSNINVATYTVDSNSSISIVFDQGGAGGNAFTLDASGTANATESGANLTGGANVSGNFELDFEFTNFNNLGENISFDVTSYTINYPAGAYSSGAIAPAFSANSVAGGTRSRTDQESATAGSLSIDLDDAGTAGLQEGGTFTIDVDIQVTDESGNIYTETVTFTLSVPDPETNIINERYAATAVSGSGDGELITASNTNSLVTAKLVDANGNTISGNDTPGYIQITTANDTLRFSIDQLTSSHDGEVGAINPLESATSKGISHFFGLNNFFNFGGELENAATNLRIRTDIKNSPSLLTSGRTSLSTQTGNTAKYTYEIGAGNNLAALDLISMQNNNLNFASAGGLPLLQTTINAYLTEIYNSASLKANTAESNFDKQELLYKSLKAKIDDVSGVNIDEELALTIQIQNSYSASARVLTVVRDLFKSLEEALL